jgi:dTMP kinase
MSTAAYWGINVIIGAEIALARFRPNRYRGKLIAAEGIDSSGRLTQLSLLHQWLRNQGVSVTLCPTEAAPAAETPMAASLLRAAALADRTENVIVPSLRAGLVSISDGYAYSAAAEDIARGLSRKWIRSLYRFAVLPNIRLYFRLPLDVALRQPQPPSLSYPHLSGNAEESFRLYQGRLVEEMDATTEEFDFHVIDATRSPEDQQREVRELVRRELVLETDAPAA